ncbi:4066_t:CDS:2 [Cetraspora pellucida]|uniref:4066_t:CDS:1 n=1 Tax=Cetraspora pellucida TaxID=1433469 RepID=A0A9N9IC20_9GLOM|nr:4066_t:CDS:2 [Cetraspora pellucida]
MKESTTLAKCKTLVQTKLNFSVALNSSFTKKKSQDNSFFTNTNISTKQVRKSNFKNKTPGNQKILTLQEFLKGSKLEKIDNWHVYCHYCNTGQSIKLHQINDSYRLWQYLKTNMHKENIEHEKANPSKNTCTIWNIKDNYKILCNDDLFDKNVKAYRYIQSKQYERYTTSKYCSKCSILSQLESVQKRNQCYQELIAQIDCLFILKEEQKILASFILKFGITWTQYDINKLYKLVISSLKNHLGNTKSTELQQLHKYVEKEIKDYIYYITINKYSAFGHIIETVEAHRLEN